MKTLILIALAAAYSYGISAGGAKFSREIELICGIQLDEALIELFFNDTASKEKEDLALMSGSHSLKVRADRERREVPAGAHEVALVLDVACI